MTIKNIFSKKVLWGIALGIVLPQLAFAVPTTVTGVIDKLCEIAGWIFTVAMIVGVALIIFAGFKYMTAAGDTEKFRTANKALLYGVIGLGVALIATSAPYILANFVGAPTSGTGSVGASLARPGCQ